MPGVFPCRAFPNTRAGWSKHPARGRKKKHPRRVHQKHPAREIPNTRHGNKHPAREILNYTRHGCTENIRHGKHPARVHQKHPARETLGMGASKTPGTDVLKTPGTEHPARGITNTRHRKHPARVYKYHPCWVGLKYQPARNTQWEIPNTRHDPPGTVVLPHPAR